MTRSSLPQYSVRIMLGGIVMIVIILALAAPLHKRFHYTKKTFFGMITAVIFSVTVALGFTHVALISDSADGGIAKRSGKIVVLACGQPISFKPSSWLSSTAGNGSYTITEEGDMNYIGYLGDATTDSTLGSFFQAANGSISSNVITLPYESNVKNSVTNGQELGQFVRTNTLHETYLELRSGESCSVTPSMVSIMVYHFDDTSRTYIPLKLVSRPEQFQLSDQTFEHRDCIVVQYGDPKDSTRNTCNGYPSTDLISLETRELSL